LGKRGLELVPVRLAICDEAIASHAPTAGTVICVQDYQDRLTLATAEGVELSVVLAGVGSRILARLIDFALIWIPLLIAGFLLAAALGNFGVALLMVDIFFVLFGYDVMCERLFNGRTLGKRMLGLRVQRDGATRVDTVSSAMRAVLTVIDFWLLSPLIAITSVLVTADNKRLGDLAGATVVIREPKAGQAKSMPLAEVAPRGRAPVSTPQLPPDWRPPAAQPTAGATAMATHLDTSAVTREDLAAINAFLERRAALEPQIRAELGARMAGALRSRVGGGVAELSDEQLLIAVAEAKSRDE
jgi:uncharacterized RDD family membrane protein YckC